MPDPIFALPRLAAIYDALDGQRLDLDAYCAIVTEFGARSVLDVGCGTGTFACALAAQGVEVIGVDPAQASLDVAQTKPFAERVVWFCGDTSALSQHATLHVPVDLVTMTGNVAQVFTDADTFIDTLRHCRDVLAAKGRLVFETRDPNRRAWERWNRDASYARTNLASVGIVEHWVELLDVALPLVSFRWTYHFEATGETIISDSTLRFQSPSDVEHSVHASGLVIDEVRDAPDRPGLEHVYVCSVE